MDWQEERLSKYFATEDKYQQQYGNDFLLLMKNDRLYNIFERRTDKGYPKITKKTRSLMISVWELKARKVLVTSFSEKDLDEYVEKLLKEDIIVIIIDEDGEELRVFLQG